MSKKVAIPARDFNWGGGLDFIHMIAEALILNSKENNFEIYLFIPKKPSLLVKTIKVSRSIIKVPYNLIKRKQQKYEAPSYFITDECLACFSDLIGNLKIVYHGVSNYLLIKKLLKCEIDIVLPIRESVHRSNELFTIGYISDLQHKYYPNFFPMDEIVHRDKKFISILRNSKSIIVNSNSVKKDIEKFYKNDFDEEKCEIFALPFTPLLKNKYKAISYSQIKEKYNLPERFFIISNQLWKHKDHITAFRALKILLDSDIKFRDINIVCTGSTYDHRFPTYFNELKYEIQNLDIDNHIHFLGYILKEEQLCIMENSLGVIQTTLFEGGPGGGSVYDAISMGIPAIVSDIEVNREIIDENVTFFKVTDEIDLYNKMKYLAESNFCKYDKQQLTDRSKRRLENLSKELYKIIEYTIT